MITTAQRVRTFSEVSNNISDDRLTMMIEVVEDFLKGYTNIDDLTTVRGAELVIINTVLYNINKKQGVASETLAGDYAISYMGVDIPKDLLSTIKRIGKFI